MLLRKLAEFTFIRYAFYAINYCVTFQSVSKDSENAKAVGPSAEEIARLEAEDTTSQASTPEVSRAPSRLANSSHQAASTSETPSTPGTPGSIPSDTASSGK